MTGGAKLGKVVVMSTPHYEPAADKRHWILPPDVFDEFIETLEEMERTGPGERTIKLFQRPSPFTKDCE